MSGVVPSRDERPLRVLFVCMGNICRSPAAEAIFREMTHRAGMADKVACDSAGIIGYHSGEKADPRMRKAAQSRGYSITGTARQISRSDLDRFDLILAMDRENLAGIRALDSAGDSKAKIRMFCEFCIQHTCEEVPDPYYGGARGFEHVLDLLEDGCSELLRQITSGRV